MEAGACAARLELPLERIADVGGDVLEIGASGRVAGNPFAVVDDPQVRIAPFASADDCDFSGAGVDRVLDELGDRLEGVRLREGDDVDGVPVVADAQSTRVIRSLGSARSAGTTRSLGHLGLLPMAESACRNGDPG